MIKKNTLLDLNLVKDNIYLDLYVNLINDNLQNKRVRYETQKHHIIPRYYYRKNNLKINDTKNNIVYLSHYNHLLAHYYLELCSHNNYKYLNGYALSRLIHPGNKEFEKTIDIKDIPNIDTDLFNKIIIETNIKRSENTKEQHKEGLHMITETQKQKISAHTKGKIWVVNCKEEKHLIYPEEWTSYEAEGFIKGKYFDKKLNPHNGMKRTQETKDKISKKCKGKKRKSLNPQLTKQKLSDALKGRSVTWGDKISNTLKNKRHWTNGVILIIQEECPGKDFYIGQPKNIKQQNKVWCNNGVIQKLLCKEDFEKLRIIDPTFVLGRIYKRKNK